MNISLIIRELLLQNQKAVVPGFGTFLIRYRSAELNKITRVLTPPSKEMYFDSKLPSDDGLLSGYMVRKLKLDKSVARAAIDEFVKTVEYHLRAQDDMLLEGFGTLIKGKSGEITFLPDEELLKRIDIVELPRLEVPVARQDSAAAVIGKTITPEKKIVVKKRKWWIPAASIVLLAGLAAVVYYSGIYESYRTDDKTEAVISNAKEEPGKLIFGNRVAADSSMGEPDTLKEKISRELDKHTIREKALSYEEPVPKQELKTSSKVSPPIHPTMTIPDKPYHIIAGAFLVPNNAERQKLRLEEKGFSPVLLPKRGDYYMVSLGSYDTNEQAVDAMRQLRKALEQELWVMKI